MRAHPRSGDDKKNERIIIVNCMDFNINDEDCQIINFTDVTPFKKLEQEE